MQELQARYGPRYRWLLLLAVMVGTMASIMSSTIVNVAIPDLSQHFVLGQERAQWVSSSFMVAMTVSMLTTPWLLARHGYRRTYSATMWLLMGGGVLGGLTDHYGVVLLARVIEGLAAGVVQPIPAIIILRAFAPHEQGRASGLFGMGVVLAPAIGPSIGGVLVDWFGWRSIFFMVVPLCLLSLMLARRLVPTTAPGGVAPDRDSAGLDWAGLLLVCCATLGLLNGLVQLHDGLDAQTVALLVGAALALAAFVWHQHRLSRTQAAGRIGPLMHLSLFHSRSFAMGSFVAFTYGMALFGSTYLLPVYLQIGLGLSASHVGTLLLPAGLMLALTMALTGKMLQHLALHALVTVGLGVLALSFGVMATVRIDTALGVLVAWTLLGRIGLGLILPSLNMGAMRQTPTALIPQGASSINFLRMLGGAVGVSLCGIVLEWRVAAHGLTLQGPPSMERLQAFNESFLLLAALCALAVPAAWRMQHRTTSPLQ